MFLMVDRVGFGQWLQAEREKHNWSQSDLERKSGKDRAVINKQERAQVAAAILFLSGMRADALATLPISCVHLGRRELHQLPERGVRTKNRKAAITYLLNIPDLLAVVVNWQRHLRDLSPDCLWYSPLTRDGMTLIPTTAAFVGRGDLVGHDLRLVCDRAGVPYLSPHKLRHGHVVYALKNAHDLADLKAISQNVMHASVTITDQVYGRLVDDDVRTVISRLGQQTPFPALGGRAGDGGPNIESKLDELISLLQRSPNFRS
jgi:integrase